MRRHCRAGSVVLVVSALLTVSAYHTDLAAPRIIMFSPAGSARPIFLTDWNENNRFMSSLRVIAIPKEDVFDRPSIAVGLFWLGPRWEPFTRDPAALARLKVSDAEQQGRLYFGPNDSSVLFVFQNVPRSPRARYRQLSPAGIETLRLHGVPRAGGAGSLSLAR